jgi:undecaprenyl diphosphate synthase
MTTTPHHVAIIMDCNGRWAKARRLPRAAGHRQGVETIKRAIEASVSAGIANLTFFGFSTENWRRPAEEVNELMRLLRLYLQGETANFHKQNIRLKVIGFREDLPADIVQLIEQAEDLTANNTRLTVCIAINYGGQQDILQAAAKLIKQGIDIDRDESSLQLFQQNLMTGDMPPVDLMIRTSGEHRISNFLLWQSAYAELYFTDTFWPDFGKDDLQSALDCFAKRERRFGTVADIAVVTTE